jgi:hypothetical protein
MADYGKVTLTDSGDGCVGHHPRRESANRAAADYLFADYRQRRAKKTLRTQTAALLLWVQYLAEVGAAGRVYYTKRRGGPYPILTQKRWLDWPSTPSRSKPLFLLYTPPITASTGRPPGKASPGGWSKALSNGCSIRVTAWPASTTGCRPSRSTPGWRPKRASSPHRTRFDW